MLTVTANLFRTKPRIRIIRFVFISRRIFQFSRLLLHPRRVEQRYMSSEPKRVCTKNMTFKKIGTHNGTFHCDEVLACFFLRQIPEYKVGFRPASECIPAVIWTSFKIHSDKCVALHSLSVTWILWWKEHRLFIHFGRVLNRASSRCSSLLFPRGGAFFVIERHPFCTFRILFTV